MYLFQHTMWMQSTGPGSAPYHHEQPGARRYSENPPHDGQTDCFSPLPLREANALPLPLPQEEGFYPLFFLAFCLSLVHLPQDVPTPPPLRSDGGDGGEEGVLFDACLGGVRIIQLEVVVEWKSA